MISVTVLDRYPDRKIRHDFFFMHSAKSWLILAGYLPSEDDNTYINVYTGSIATLGVRK